MRRKRGDGVEKLKVGNAVVTVYQDRHSTGRPLGSIPLRPTRRGLRSCQSPLPTED